MFVKLRDATGEPAYINLNTIEAIQVDNKGHIILHFIANDKPFMITNLDDCKKLLDYVNGFEITNIL